MHNKPKLLHKTLAAAIRRKADHRIETGNAASHATIASYNIHKCVGTDGRFDAGRIAAVLAELDADIVALQEVDERLGARRGLLNLDMIERETGLAMLQQPRHTLSHGWHGNLILARASVAESIEAIRLPGLEPRGAVVADLTFNGVPLRVIAAHFGLLRHSRNQQASALLQKAQSASRPTFLLGDLNEWRVQSRSSLLNLLPHFGPIHAVVPSFPSRFPLLALDRILARPADLIQSIEVHRSPLARIASDHLPLKAHINLSVVQEVGAHAA